MNGKIIQGPLTWTCGRCFEEAATAKCTECGYYLCEACLRVQDGVLLCPRCANGHLGIRTCQIGETLFLIADNEPELIPLTGSGQLTETLRDLHREAVVHSAV